MICFQIPIFALATTVDVCILFNVKELYGLLGLKKVPLKKRESCMITGFSLFMMPEQFGKLISFFDLQMVFVCNAAILVFQFGY